MRRLLVSAANMARKWVQGEALPVHAAILVSADNSARKWVQGETLPAASCGDIRS